MSNKQSMSVKEFVIETDLPDGRYWFCGVALVGTGDTAVYMNEWNCFLSELAIDKGKFTMDECQRYVKALDMEGLTIKTFYQAVVDRATYVLPEPKKPMLHDGSRDKN